MNKADFFKNFIDFSKRDDFLFYIPGEEIADPKKISLKKRIGFKVVMDIGMALAGNPTLGFLMSQNSFNLSTESKESLILDLQKIHDYCDFVGIKLSNGPVILRVGIDTDDMLDETLVGRFATLHEKAHDFKKHSSTLMKSRFGETKFAVYMQVAIVFSTHQRAKNFTEHFADKCSHSAFWKKIYTSPWIIDLEDEDIKRYRQLDNLFGNGEKFKAELFRK